MLDPRLRQLHDEPRSGGNQSAHQRMINRRFNDRASCFAQRRLYCEGNAKKEGEDFLRLLLETANIRVPLHSDFDWLGLRWLQGGQERAIDHDGDTARYPWAA